ncbi:hypothetical protein A3J90_04805 [candidate division WOR-1 bacterium RIFOXYC2_FULL_37_10]|uniref:Ferredoxin n=1 Tax=candidate division WOR-1 bacterium RIFOXYB2_FULL_37_13 TaxID=1802579 RepID=A0A1F4SVJ2_UNCSA|nr:MAG: hypothetical protein A2246_06345 [candidate division WOR-1 bacterium RIFOXYA2_FULL_37_7]OGC24446.1 MAG: hypothetical protein A2310_08575 [candidate division WOR-1 bacterium RIFOXYB2_FULL_37_13]OGC35544.1 MAG: hypothetical protein A3J90_04805 [candidate division WOR-1 bacterium RIFOXYC2_FULL_37_10]
MAVKVDQSLCIGCGICVDACPEVFSFDSEGKAIVIKQACETCSLEEIEDMCPVEAIEVSN